MYSCCSIKQKFYKVRCWANLPSYIVLIHCMSFWCDLRTKIFLVFIVTRECTFKYARNNSKIWASVLRKSSDSRVKAKFYKVSCWATLPPNTVSIYCMSFWCDLHTQIYLFSKITRACIFKYARKNSKIWASDLRKNSDTRVSKVLQSPLLDKPAPNSVLIHCIWFWGDLHTQIYLFSKIPRACIFNMHEKTVKFGRPFWGKVAILA